MTRDETVALFEACEAKRREARAAALAEGKSDDDAENIAHEAAKAHWNAWAEPLLTKRKALEEAGAWKSGREWPWKPEKGENPKTQAWLDKAFADFSRCILLVPEVEGTKETAGEEKEDNSGSGMPVKSIQLEGNSADFSDFIFPGDARFDSATFSGHARFDSATFSRDARFDSATFSGYALFESATFSGYARFDSATFSRDALFESATFSGHARFDSATFSRDAWFESVTFSGRALFESATFSGYALFESARFHREALFSGINSQRAFRLIGARFQREVPDFLSAKFAEPVLLDNVRLAAGVEPGGLLRSIFGGVLRWKTGKLDAALSAKYRTLKRLAIESDDHRNEQIFFRGELRARRYNEDKPWHPAFWFGILYEIASDFGRSIMRPILLLIALSLISSWFYLGRHLPPDASPRPYIQARLLSHLPVPASWLPAPPPLSCKDGGPGDPAAAAELLAFKKTSVFASFDSAEKSSQIYACLYGVHAGGKTPVVPDAVVFWGIWQTMLSAALLFLFLLGLRNQFKIR